jgi:hypothetical protein
MAALGIVLAGWLGNQSGPIELGDRSLHFTAMAEQDFEPIEVLVLQIGKDTNVDPILGKTLRVLPKPKLFEPVRNLLHGCVPATLLRPADFFGPRQKTLCLSARRLHMLVCGIQPRLSLNPSLKRCMSTANRYHAAHRVAITTSLRRFTPPDHQRAI